MNDSRSFRASCALAFGCMVLVPACAPSEARDDEATATSEDAYRVWQQGSTCLVRKSLAPELRVCVTGQGDIARGQKLARESLVKWLDALRPIEPNVTSSVVISCSKPDVTIYIANSGEYTTAGHSIYVNASSAPGTYLHEFGHAFACLHDTYYGGAAGYCQAGQPHSVMCDGLLRNDLTSDDVAGVRAQFQAMVRTGGGGTTNPNDTDNDGIANNVDRCPSTPQGSHVWGEQYGGRWRGCAAGETPVF